MNTTEIEKAKLAIEEPDILKSSFLSSMSHEVRTQLNGILGLAQMILHSKETDTDIRNDVKMIVESGNSLLSLFDNIIEMMKIEEGQIKLNNRPFHLNSLMDEVYSLFVEHPFYKRKNGGKQNVIMKYDKPAKNLNITGDSERIKQVLVNLINNSLKFTERGYIYFGYTVNKGEIVFYVMDSGIGIPLEKRETIFDRFTQEDNTLVRKYRGAGLGLPICKGLVTLMNGKIWCVSDVDKGSSFNFSIPHRPASMQPFTDSVPLKKKIMDKDWSKYTVLIVEGDVINHKIIRAMLRNTKVNLIHANNGMKAIEEVRSNPQIDLTLMNEHLSDMNGLETACKILDINPTIPVIAQTTNSKSEFTHKCLEAGCVDYISKPTRMGELFTKMSKFLPDQSFNLMSN